MKFDKNKVNIILFWILFIGYCYSEVIRPWEVDYPYGEAMLHDRLPPINAFEKNIKIRDVFRVYTTFKKPHAGIETYTNWDDREVIAYYEKELLPYGYSEFREDSRRLVGEWMYQKSFGSRNEELNIVVSIDFDARNNKDGKVWYRVEFIGYFDYEDIMRKINFILSKIQG